MRLILILALLQSLYDFVGWFGIIQNWAAVPEHAWQAKLYRVIKETLDIPVTFVILYFYLNISLPLIAAFYTAKWFHLCDSLYNIEEYILTNKPTENWGYWRFWTPIGLLRTNFWGFCIIRGYTQLDYNEKSGYWGSGENIFEKYPHSKSSFIKGMVSIKEAWIQTFIGLVPALLINLLQ
jgi:hypothetical protein